MVFLKTFCTLALLTCCVFVIHGEYRAARVDTLNFFIPSSYMPLLEAEGGSAPVDRAKLEQYKFYYEKLVRYKPDLADGFMMLGFCEHYLGDNKKTERSFKKALRLNPHLPWIYYNLGVMAYNKQDYKNAIDMAKQGLAVNPQAVPVFLSTSKVYRDILTSTPSLAGEIPKRIKRDYRGFYQILVLSSYHLKDFPQMAVYAKEALSQFGDEAGVLPIPNENIADVRIF